MKLIQTITFLILTIASFSCFAILSPYYQSTKELNSILALPELSNKLKQQEILKIEKVESGYKIETYSCVALITIEYINDESVNIVGPQQFKLHLESADCK